MPDLSSVMLTPLSSVLLLLTLGVAFVALARALRLPSLLAYLSIGMLLGPHGLGLLVETEQTSDVAEFGVVFLMFSIGLEFSLSRLFSMRHLVFGLGGAQVLITLGGTVLVTLLVYDQDWRVGVAVGAACAMSSTAIVSKVLSERLELHSQAGRQTMAVLLFQDLAVVPLLILIPALGARSEHLGEALSIAMGQAALVLVAMVLVGQRLVGRWFNAIARMKSAELSMLNVLWIVVGLSFLTFHAGLSMALGAFIGGMLIAETLYRHQVEADIRPFRDVFLGLFFVTIGMLLDLPYVLRNLPAVLLALVLLILAKAGVVLVLGLIKRNSPEVALRTAFQLAQGGEFGFVLLDLSQDNRLIPGDIFQVTMAAMLLSMFLAPLLIARAAHWGGRLSAREWQQRTTMVHQVAVRSMGIEDHVILCGFGRTGQSLGRFLDREQIPFIALDIDEARIHQAVEAGENVVFGNADRREILVAAGIDRARALVITYGDLPATERVLELVRDLRPQVPVIVRAHDDSQLEHLKTLGATEVIPEVLEGSLMLAAETLSHLGVPTERTMEQVREVRSHRYDTMRSFYRGESDRLKKLSLSKAVFPVEPGCFAVGKSLAELELGNVVVAAIRRHGVKGEAPSPETRVAVEDILILEGHPNALGAAERYLLSGKR